MVSGMECEGEKCKLDERSSNCNRFVNMHPTVLIRGHLFCHFSEHGNCDGVAGGCRLLCSKAAVLGETIKKRKPL